MKRKLDFLALCSDAGIPHETEGEHSRPGWVQVNCPFCDSRKFHMGFNLQAQYFSCWRCGFHPFKETLSLLLQRKSFNPQLYYSVSIPKHGSPLRIQGVETCILPSSNKQRMSLPHSSYLKSRGFLPKQLAEQWGIYSANHIGDYKHRIIIPIHYEGEVVSFTSRTACKNVQPKYLACAASKEVVSRKSVLYGIDQAWEHGRDGVIVVEGPIDVWRFGFGAVSTFGTQFTKSQVGLLNRFRKVFIIFDPEKEAQKSANKLARQLVNCDIVEVIDLVTSDPGDLAQGEADEIKKELLGHV